jgi:haloacid dehalogenase superfamily, subfamily IA, variant 3 with third motif having DD or ED/haloacid dehalogenase superfamily, subfamily IA, variant 1 with third motif having Dx(3-4)D or Dx(3-4)E
MIKAALFDLDGVVFDTEPQYSRFWGSQFQLYYPDMPGMEQRIKGMTLVQIYDQYFADKKDEQSKITERLNAYELQMEYEYIAGFESFVTALRKQGIKTAVVTSSNLEKMANVYRHRPEMKDYFDVILTSEDFERSKPDPDGYLKGAAHFGIDPKECVGFEDSVNGLKAVRAAGLLTVGLTTTNSRETVATLADIVVDDFTQLDLSTLSIR